MGSPYLAYRHCDLWVGERMVDDLAKQIEEWCSKDAKRFSWADEGTCKFIDNLIAEVRRYEDEGSRYSIALESESFTLYRKAREENQRLRAALDIARDALHDFRTDKRLRIERDIKQALGESDE